MKYFLAVPLVLLIGCAAAQVQTAEAQRAKEIWLAACSFCHGVDGNPPPEWKATGIRRFGTFGMKMGFFFGGDRMRAGIARVIAEGKGSEMKAFRGYLSEAEIRALVRHIENL